MEKVQLLVPGRGHGRASLERAETAAEYHNRFGTSRIVFSGGSWILGRPNREKSEATLMFDHVEKRLHGTKAMLDHDADTSFGNFANSMSLLDPHQPVGIVTHGDHMARLMLIAKKMLSNECFAVIVPETRCSLQSWATEALLCEFTRAAFLGANKKNLDHLRKRNEVIERTAKALHGLYNK